jgi:hypothetical protein
MGYLPEVVVKKILLLIQRIKCKERQVKNKGSKLLAYTGLCGGMRYLKIQTTLKGEKL